MNQIKKSQKQVPKHILKLIKYDVNSVTGSNLRKIMLLLDKNNIDELSPTDSQALIYHEIPEDQTWRINMVRELINIRYQECYLENFSFEELDIIMEVLCTS